MADLSSPDVHAAQPLDHALALSARYYTAPHMPQLDATAVFAQSWQLVCHQSQLSGVGDHVVTQIAGLPLLIVRSDESTVGAFHNVCRHRAGPIANCDGCGARDIAFSDEVQDEDVTICQEVQRGLASSSYEAGRLNPLRENAVHHFHEPLHRAYREQA